MHRWRRSHGGGGGAGLTLDFKRDGARLFPAAALNCLEELNDAFADLPADRAGIRLRDLASLATHVGVEGAIGSIAALVLGGAARPVRAIYFDKSETANWALDWHQDRTIAVESRRLVEGFGPWTTKQGVLHVTPPAELLASMVTLRVHLDDVDEDNAPLLIAPGSHRAGRVAENEIERLVARCGNYACAASAGDIWLYATLIVHASKRAKRPRRRRVLQIDYAAVDLPGGLSWTQLLPQQGDV